jgi:uncharacterized protein (TIGR02996 family)
VGLEQAFLDDIHDDPDEDALRLVYADWLDEQGRTARAAFIRTLCELARLEAAGQPVADLQRHEAELLRRHRHEWLPPLPGWCGPVVFRRGFPEVDLWLPPLVWPENEPGPEDLPPDAEEAFQRWQGAASRELPGALPPGVLVGAFVSRDDEQPRWYTYANRLDAGWLRRWPPLAWLTRLDLQHCWIGPDGVRALGACPAAAGLRELGLADNSLGTEGVGLLAQAPHLTRLTALDLSENTFGLPAFRALAASPLAGRLTRLRLRDCRLYAEEVLELLAGPGLGRLRELDLSANFTLGADVAVALAEWSGLRRLRLLDLSEVPLGDDGAEALAAVSGLSGVGELRLDRTGLGDRGVTALARSPHLAGLGRLSLRGNNFTTGGKLVLREGLGERVTW